MATRTQKAARKAKAEASKEAKPARPSQSAKPTEGKAGKAAAPKAAASKPAKAAKGRRSKAANADADTDAQPRVVAPVGDKPGFFDRLRQRRAEKAEARDAEWQRREAERQAETQRRLQEDEAERQLRAQQEAEERARQEAEERKRLAAAKRAEARAAKEEAARREAEEAERKVEEKARRAADKAAEEERRAAEKAAAQEEAKARRAAERQAKRLELEARERQLAEEQAARDAEAEVEARRLAASQRLLAEEEARQRAANQIEPDLEFEEASKQVDPAHALVPTGKPGAANLDTQADKVAAELARRRSKPVVIVGEDLPIPKIPKSSSSEPAPDLDTREPEVDEKYQTTPPAPAPTGLSIPEMFLLVANEGGWDERIERTRRGNLGGALTGALMLELLQHRRILVQRDRFTLAGEPTQDAALTAVVAKLRRILERKPAIASLRQMQLLAKWNRELLEPFKDRLSERGLAQHGHRMHLGLFHRSFVNVLDLDAQERLRNKLRRAIAGGGTPEASSILLLGLLDAAGLLGSIVPDEAMDYNRKRLNGLLSGRDIMGYKVDAQLKATQEIAVRTILQNVRALTS